MSPALRHFETFSNAAQPALRGRSPAKLLLLFAVLAAVAFAGYQRLYSSFAPYDDEGYIMLSFKTFSEGAPLYDETFSQYGPAYYFTHAAIHRWSGLPISHDVTRLKTLTIWLLTACLAGALVARLTRSPILGLVALVLGFFHLERLAMEPGHPQELCVLLMAALIFAATFADRLRFRTGLLVALGLLIGTTAAVKPNIGLFLFAAFATVLSLRAPRGGFAGRLATLWQVLVIALPLLLLRNVLFSGGLVLAGVVSFSLAAAIVAARSRTVNVNGATTELLRNAAVLVVSSGGAVLMWCGAAWLHGTSFTGLFQGLVWQHTEFGETFFAGSPLKSAALPWSAAALWLAWAAARGNSTCLTIARGLFAAIIFVVAFFHVAETSAPLAHGLTDRGQALFVLGFATPLAWCVVWPSRQTAAGDKQFFARLALCLTAVLQALGIFPTPGTQTAIASLAVILTGIVVVGDLMRNAEASQRAPSRSALIGGLAALSLATVIYHDVFLWRYRRTLEPLDLPGAQRLRLPPAEVAQYRWLTEVLSEQSDTFLFRYNGINSLYFWTQKHPPTAMNATCWPVLFDDSRQARICDAVTGSARVCVVWQPQSWPSTRDDAPLVSYLSTEFEPRWQHQDFEIWCRKAG